MKIAIQIGTNCANDFFIDICKENKFDMIYLIEPTRRFNKIIHEKYNDLNHTISNIAITPYDIKTAKLYKMHESGEMDSLIKRKSHPVRESGKELDYIIVPCTTINAFCKENNIEIIDLLCMDIEGLDDEILMSIDFNTITIKKIIWEYWNHDDDDENNVYRTGSVIQKEVREKLKHEKYIINNYGHDMRDLCATRTI